MNAAERAAAMLKACFAKHMDAISAQPPCGECLVKCVAAAESEAREAGRREGLERIALLEAALAPFAALGAESRALTTRVDADPLWGLNRATITHGDVRRALAAAPPNPPAPPWKPEDDQVCVADSGPNAGEKTQGHSECPECGRCLDCGKICDATTKGETP